MRKMDFVVTTVLSLMLFVFQMSAAQAPAGYTCPSTGWCQTWPVSGLNVVPPVGTGWTRLLFDTVLDRAIAFQENNTGVYTFSYSWFSYGYLPTTLTSGLAWRMETDSGEVPKTNGTNVHGFVNFGAGGPGTNIQAGDMSFTLVNNADLPNFHPVSAFTPPQIPTLWIDDEEIQYQNIDLSSTSATYGLVAVAKRGIRGTSAAAHNSGAEVFQGSSFPTGRQGGNMVPMNDHIQPRHPWRQMAFDSKRERWWQGSGKPEISNFTDTWYYCPNVNAYCPTAPNYIHVPASNAPSRGDGAMEYDPDHDVLVLYGGTKGGSDTDTTYIFCIDAANPSLGCPTANQWYLVPTSCSGTRWDGNPCSQGNPGPGLRNTHGLFFDPSSHRLVLFGGENQNASGCLGPSSPPYIWNFANCASEPNDVWAYDVGTKTWTKMTNTGQVPAPDRRPAMAFDTKRGNFVLFEGPVSTIPVVGAFQQGVYTLTLNSTNNTANWTLTNVGIGNTQPPTPYSQGCNTPQLQCDHGLGGMVYDAVNDVFIYMDRINTLGLTTYQLPGNTISNFVADTVPPRRPQGLILE